jgi:hypothetical protein
MSAPSFMARFGVRLVANGYSVIPIQPGTKKPGCYRDRQWRDYPGWTRHASRATTDLELQQWSGWPEAGVGIVAGSVAGIDIDVADDAELALRIDQLARERLGDTPAVRIGRPPKRLLVYRTAAPFKGLKRHPLEVLCLGQQFVAYAMHPGTGRPYDWPEEGLADLDIGSLPAIDEEQVRAFLDEAIVLLPQALRPASLAEPSGAPRGAHAQQGTPEAVQAALAFIPNADLDYDSWVRIGLALKGALGDAGAELFAAWSAQSAKDVPAFTAKIWAGFRPTSIGAGTIYRLAMERGWKPAPAIELDGSAPRDVVHPAAGMLAKIESARPIEVSRSEPASFNLVLPDGLVGDLARYMTTTARRAQPLLSLGASLCAVGAVMGRKYRTESNLRSNLYIVGVADSGSGKNHSREVINDVFLAAGLVDHLGGNKIASGSGLLTAVHRQPAILFQIDEFGMFLSAAADRRRSPQHITAILDNMTELYTAAGGIFLGAEYANRDGHNDRRDINQPCLCVYGTTTPKRFWDALQGANVLDGSLARFIILPTEDDYPDENQDSGIRTLPAALVGKLRLVADGGGGQTGNLVGRTAGPETAVDPMIVPMQPGAKDAFRALGAEITRELREARGTAFTAILARIGENAQKLALVRAVGIDPVAPVISGGDADWAIGLVRHFALCTITAVERHVADNETERNHKRVLEIIRSSGDDGLGKSELIRRTQFVDKRQRDEILFTLQEAGLVTMAMRSTPTKPGLSYRAAEPRR